MKDDLKIVRAYLEQAKDIPTRLALTRLIEVLEAWRRRK